MIQVHQPFVRVDSQLEVIDCEDEESATYGETMSIAKIPIKSTTIATTDAQYPRDDKMFLQPPTEAFKVFEKSLRFHALFGILIGTDMSYGWKWNRRFVLVYVLIAIFWILLFYTQLLHVHNNDNKRTLEQFAMYGTAGSIIFKIFCYEQYFKRITALFDATFKICQQAKGSRGQTLTKRLNANHSFYIFLCILTFSILVMYLHYPIKRYIIDHELVPVLPIEIMFVDQSTVTGFLLANVIFLMFGAFGISVVAYVGLIFDIAVMNYAPRVDILEIDFIELDELWSDPSISTGGQRRTALKNICQKYIDLIGYVDEIKQIYEQNLFLCFGSSYLSQIICLYQFRVNNWMNGCTFVVGMFVEMIVYCLMGTEITIQNERLSHIITQSKWYTYDQSSQYLILQLLNLSMNLSEVWIGPLKPLNVLTASEITKSIYSYYTIMSEVL